jgi:Cu/Zn superoxide dismutase
VPANGPAAGPHYNESTVNGVVPPVVNDQTEVWLDVTVGAAGSAVAVARVPFVPVPGNRAVVLHAMQTDEHGTAGARIACLPVSWS